MNTPERVTKILEMLADGPWGVSEIGRKLSIGKTNVCRVLAALESTGWIQQDNETKKYNLTGAMVEVAFRSLSRLGIQKVTVPYLHALRSLTGETCSLHTKMGIQRVCIDCLPGTHNLRNYVSIGTISPLWYGSAGKVILAFLPEDEIDAVLEEFVTAGALAFPSGQAITIDSLKEQLAQIRTQGYAVAAGERSVGVRGLSAPIFDHTQRVVGAITLSGPESRLTVERALDYSHLVVEKARSISGVLGARMPEDPGGRTVAA